MYGILDEIIRDIICSNKKFSDSIKTGTLEDINKEEIKYLYEKILDKMVINML